MWREPTEADLLAVLNALETDAYQGAAIADGQDVFRDAMLQTVNYCRGFIESNPANSLAAGDTIPDAIMRPAMHLLRIEMLTRLELTVDEDRRKAGDRAERFLERVAEGKFKIERPASEEEAPAAVPVQQIEMVKGSRRQWTRKQQRGL